MAEFEYVPEDRRQKIEDLLARGQSSRAIELLEVSVRQFAVTRWAMQLLGELQLKAGNRDRGTRAPEGHRRRHHQVQQGTAALHGLGDRHRRDLVPDGWCGCVGAVVSVRWVIAGIRGLQG